MAGYEDTKKMIIDALLGRPSGTEIQPDKHQAFALNMLEYIRSIELLSNAPLIGIAESDTVPVQPNDSRACYVSVVDQDRTVTFNNFHDSNGVPISITNGKMESCFVVFVWNGQYWSYKTITTNITNFFYNFSIRKTYGSVAEMNSDVESPIGNDGEKIKIGEIVSVHNENNSTEDAIYSWEKGPKWQIQTKLSAPYSCVLSDTEYNEIENKDPNTLYFIYND